MRSSKKQIFDALTSDSSRDGCDADWRAEVLGNADEQDLAFIRRELSRDELNHEKLSRLLLEGKL